jgi:hypothetical protein
MPLPHSNQVTLTAGVLREDALRTTGDGLELDVRLPWYRSLPVSCVEAVEVTVAGRPVDPDGMRFRLREHTWPLSELGEQWREWWFVLDPATLVIADPPEVARAAAVRVSVRLDCRIPYIVVGPNRALVQSVRVEKELLIT